MGLDMYLIKKTHFYNMGDKNKPLELPIDVSYNKNDFIISSDVIYWRKANQIHKWFVDNVQNGIDDCGTYFVDFKQLEELKNLCYKVLEEKNYELLPPKNGTFFGSTDINDVYWVQIENTFKQLFNLIDDFLKEKEIIEKYNNKKHKIDTNVFSYFEYSSSW